MKGFEQKSCVIDNDVCQKSPVIDNAKSKSRREFDRFADDLRMLIAVKRSASGKSGGSWWVHLPESLRLYLLHTVAPDDFGRYAATGWDGLPSGLRAAMWLECQKTLRALQGCPWH